jgi:Smg protein
MKEEQNFLQVIINLLDTDLWRQSLQVAFAEPKTLHSKLKKAGFEKDQIRLALAWFKQLHAAIHSFTEPAEQPSWHTTSYRVYDPTEITLLSADGIHYLAKLEELKILDVYTKEIVLDMLFTLDAFEIDTPLIKWVTLIVLYALPNHQAQLLALELLVLDAPQKRVH